MSDINLDKESQQPESAEAVTETQKPKKKSLQEKISGIPGNIDTAIEEGKANGVIEAVQDMLQRFLTSTFESCRIASLQLFMLTKEQRQQLTKRIYIVAVILAALICIDLIFEFSIETILFALAFLVSAYLADIITQKAVLKHKRTTTLKVKQKAKHPPKHNTDNDIL